MVTGFQRRKKTAIAQQRPEGLQKNTRVRESGQEPSELLRDPRGQDTPEDGDGLLAVLLVVEREAVDPVEDLRLGPLRHPVGRRLRKPGPFRRAFSPRCTRWAKRLGEDLDNWLRPERLVNTWKYGKG